MWKHSLLKDDFYKCSNEKNEDNCETNGCYFIYDNLTIVWEVHKAKKDVDSSIKFKYICELNKKFFCDNLMSLIVEMWKDEVKEFFDTSFKNSDNTVHHKGTYECIKVGKSYNTVKRGFLYIFNYWMLIPIIRSKVGYS